MDPYLSARHSGLPEGQPLSQVFSSALDYSFQQLHIVLKGRSPNVNSRHCQPQVLFRGESSAAMISHAFSVSIPDRHIALQI